MRTHPPSRDELQHMLRTLETAAKVKNPDTLILYVADLIRHHLDLLKKLDRIEKTIQIHRDTP